MLAIHLPRPASESHGAKHRAVITTGCTRPGRQPGEVGERGASGKRRRKTAIIQFAVAVAVSSHRWSCWRGGGNEVCVRVRVRGRGLSLPGGPPRQLAWAKKGQPGQGVAAWPAAAAATAAREDGRQARQRLWQQKDWALDTGSKSSRVPWW